MRFFLINSPLVTFAPHHKITLLQFYYITILTYFNQFCMAWGSIPWKQSKMSPGYFFFCMSGWWPLTFAAITDKQPWSITHPLSSEVIIWPHRKQDKSVGCTNWCLWGPIWLTFVAGEKQHDPSWKQNCTQGPNLCLYCNCVVVIDSNMKETAG